MMRSVQSCPRKVGMLLVLLSGACAGPSATSPDVNQEIKVLAQRMHAMEAYQGEQECGDDLRRLLSDARAECSSGSATSPAPSDGAPESKSAYTTASASSSVNEDLSCSSDQLKGAIKAAEHALYSVPAVAGKRKAPRASPLGRMLDRFRCEVLYLDGESEQSPGARIERLSDMVQLPLLPQTRYIILASTIGGEIEARHRAGVMRRQIELLKVPPERIDKSWVYPFELQPSQIHKPGLLPQKPNETSDLARAVWACRTSC